MLRVFFLLLCVSATFCLHFCSKQNDIILDQFSEYSQKSKLENKHLLVIFGADWCPDCHALNEILKQPEPKLLLEQNFIVFAVDVGRFDKNLALNENLGSPITNGIPAVVVLNPEGKILSSTKGGEFSNARNMSKDQVLKYLYQF
ncbi:thioredoxin family protein [Leptospira sp. 96542]|nr:thioredoxin family protein [Leptospira sp. 96542]